MPSDGRSEPVPPHAAPPAATPGPLARVLRCLRDGLPVEARWLGPADDDGAILCWPRPAADDPRGALALEILRAVRAGAAERGLALRGARLALAWGRRHALGRRLHAELTVASPEPASRVHALAQAAVAGLRRPGVELLLECQPVDDERLLVPTHLL